MDGTHKMYAKGPDWWIDYFADTGLTEDRWIKAMEIRPGNRRIVHHVGDLRDRARRAARNARQPASSCTSTRSASTATPSTTTPAAC